MNRIITILLACCVLFSNTGWALNTHYCMGERVGMNLEHSGFDNDLHECPKCGMKKSDSNNGCCKDEKIVVKTSDAATLVFDHFQVNPVWLDLPVSTITPVYNNYRFAHANMKGRFRPPGPPFYSGPPLFLKNCVFLI